MTQQQLLICTWPNLQLLVHNLPGPLCSIRAKRSAWVLKGELSSLKELYLDDGTLFCQYCEHSVEFVQVDTSLKLSLLKDQWFHYYSFS